MNVFTYGSLMFDPVWQRVVRASYSSAGCSLDGFARFAVRGQAYPGIVPKEGSRVRGLLYLGVRPADIAALDRFEGSEYARIPITVTLDGGMQRAADTYIYLYPQNLTGSPWIPEDFDCAAFLGGEHCRDTNDERG